LLVPVFRQGKRTYEPPPIKETRQHSINQVAKLRPEWSKLSDAAPYTVGLEKSLYELKLQLMAEAREKIGQ
jgi:nicotinate phosphoribosyltransferase